MKTFLPDRVGSYNDFSHAGTPIAWHSTRGPFERGEQRDGAILRRPLQKQVKGNAMSGKVFAGMARAGAMALMVLAVGGAHAAKYTGSWDPLYGPPFTNIGWRGEATFEFTGNCLVADGTVNFGCTGSGTAKVLDATVEFYDAMAPTLALTTLTWTSPTTFFNSATFAGGVLTSISTGFLGLIDGVVLAGQETSLTTQNLDDYSFFLKFTAGTAQLTHVVNPPPSSISPTDCDKSLMDLGYCGLSGVSDEPVAMRFAAVVESVPEPQTYALMLAALAAAGLITRRRRH